MNEVANEMRDLMNRLSLVESVSPPPGAMTEIYNALANNPENMSERVIIGNAIRAGLVARAQHTTASADYNNFNGKKYRFQFRVIEVTSTDGEIGYFLYCRPGYGPGSFVQYSPKPVFEKPEGCDELHVSGFFYPDDDQLPK